MISVAERLGLVNHEAENTVLAVMRDSEDLALAFVQQLDENSFHDPRRRIVFAAMRNILLGTETFNRENILVECKRVALDFNKKTPVSVPGDFLDSLKGAPANSGKAATTVHRLAWLRQAGDYAHWLVKALQLNPDPNELYTEAQSRWQLLAPKTGNGATLYGWDTIQFGREIAIQRAAEKETGALRRFDWPWSSWNQHVRPLRAGLLGMLAAPDGVGKSTYLEWIAEHWAMRGNKTVLVHLEDDHSYKIDRRKSRWAQVPLAAIEDEELTPAQEGAIAEAENRNAEWVGNLHYTHAPGWSMAQVATELQKLRDEGQCDCAVIDYIDKCGSDRRQVQLYGNNQYLREGDNVEQLKNLAEKMGIPVFTATQGNKGMLDQGREKTRQDIDGTQKKSARSQLVIILTRDMVGPGGLWEGAEQIAKEGDYAPIAKLRIDKQNRGKTMTFFQAFRGECYRIGDLPEGYDMSKVRKDGQQ